MAGQEFLVSEAARMLGCAAETVRNFEKRGVVAFRRVGGMRVISVEDLATLRNAMKTMKRGRPSKVKPKAAVQVGKQ